MAGFLIFGKGGIEPPTFCSQSRWNSRYPTSRLFSNISILPGGRSSLIPASADVHEQNAGKTELQFSLGQCNFVLTK